MDEQQNAAELSRVIEEQCEQLEQLKKERDVAKQRLESAKNDIQYMLQRDQWVSRSKHSDIAKLEEEYMTLVLECDKAKEEANKAKEKVK